MDMDGVGYDYPGGHQAKMREMFPNEPELALQHRRRYSDLAHPDVDPLKVQAVKDAPGLFAGLELIDGYVEAVMQMHEDGHYVTFASTPTTSNPTCAQDKFDAIERDFGAFWASRLVLVQDKTTLKADFLFDDHPEIAGFYEPSWTQILVDQPYNAYCGDSLTRVSDLSKWREAIEESHERKLNLV